MDITVGCRLGRMLGVALLLAVFGLFLSVEPAVAATITVTNNLDDVAPNNGCSLREAIANANANAQTHPDCAAGEGGGTVDTIAFNIPGAGRHVISPGSPLPNIINAVLIDGLSQPSVPDNLCPLPFGGPLAIQIDGTVAGSSKGLFLEGGSDGSSVRGLSITNFSTAGINAVSTDVNIACNILGVEADGSDDGSNGVSAHLYMMAVTLDSKTQRVSRTGKVSRYQLCRPRGRWQHWPG